MDGLGLLPYKKALNMIKKGICIIYFISDTFLSTFPTKR